MLKIFKWALGLSCILLILCLSFIYFGIYHPKELEPQVVVNQPNIPILKSKQKIKILSWNIQYLAGKNYVFFYDLLDGSGPDIRPSSEDIEKTTLEVVKIIKAENPDIILLQEVDEGSARTDYEDQLQKLLHLLPSDYRAHTSAFYWKTWFVPHPKIMGKIGMKLSIISKYQIKNAIRHQLAQIEEDAWYSWIKKQFNLKRAIQEAILPIENGQNLYVLNTHLEAFAQGTSTMEQQVAYTRKLLETKSNEGVPWLIGGDFNLLPPGKSYDLADSELKAYYKPKSEIAPLFQLYQAVPSQAEADSSERKKWFTHFPNNPKIKAPDRIIDYIFLSNNLKILNHYVRHQGTLTISDHLPVVVEIEIP